MSDGGLTILDGTQLRAVNLSLPSPAGSSVTGAQLLDFAESKVSESLFGFSLPDALKSAALKRIGVSDDLEFRLEQLDCENALSVLQNYVDAIANELQGEYVDLFRSKHEINILLLIKRSKYWREKLDTCYICQVNF